MVVVVPMVHWSVPVVVRWYVRGLRLSLLDLGSASGGRQHHNQLQRNMVYADVIDVATDFSLDLLMSETTSDIVTHPILHVCGATMAGTRECECAGVGRHYIRVVEPWWAGWRADGGLVP